jgi:hypothetical protein
MFVRKRVARRAAGTRPVRREVFRAERLSPEAREVAAMVEREHALGGDAAAGWRTPGWRQVHADLTAGGRRWETVAEPVPARETVTYAIVEAYRDAEGRPRQRQLAHLGAHPTPEGRLAELRERHAQAVERADPEAVARGVERLREARALMGGGQTTEAELAAWREDARRNAQARVDELAAAIARLEALAATLAGAAEAAA